ncbi:hypothetical protein EQV77_08545 [Halobacillus fulvus]|nr:hypothetical protein EQV77_08545 [Halobacillus fulvus]
MKSIIGIVLAVVIAGAGAYPQERLDKEYAIMDFAAFAEGEQLEVQEWNVTFKETIDMKDIEQVEKNVKQTFPTMKKNVEESRETKKIVWKDTHKKEEPVEYFYLIVPKSGINQVEMVYVLEGRGTSSLTQKHIQKSFEKKSRLFSKNVTIFSCLKADADGIMNDVLVYQKFKHKFNIETLDEVIDHNWTSRSGYSNEWGQSLPLTDEVMNVQFGTRTLGGKTNITIGTPVITAEY